VALDFEQVQKPGRKLRKLLKRMPAQPSRKQIHDFRTNSRQIEATLQAFGLDAARNGRRVLKPLSRLRKCAGKIRDMDVFTSYATNVHPDDGEQDCAVQMLEYLGARRRKYAKKFHTASRQDGSKLRQRLKRVLRQLRKRNSRIQKDGRTDFGVPASVLDLASDLASPSRLNRANLHSFRLKVKELRNVLNLAEAPDQAFVNALGRTKDAIGEWHDWEELVAISEKILDHGAQCHLVQQLKAIAAEKYQSALSNAVLLRKRYLGAAGNGKPGGSRNTHPPQPALAVAMKLAA